MVRSDALAELEARWHNICPEFNQGAGCSKRDNWIECYLNYIFWAGMTSGNDSTNAYFNGYGHSYFE